MQEQNKNLKVVFTLSEPSEDWTNHVGRIDAEMVKQEMPDYMQRVFYTCGPPAMVQAMENLLKELGVPTARIKTENFPGY